MAARKRNASFSFYKAFSSQEELRIREKYTFIVLVSILMGFKKLVEKPPSHDKNTFLVLQSGTTTEKPRSHEKYTFLLLQALHSLKSRRAADPRIENIPLSFYDHIHENI